MILSLAFLLRAFLHLASSSIVLPNGATWFHSRSPRPETLREVGGVSTEKRDRTGSKAQRQGNRQSTDEEKQVRLDWMAPPQKRGAHETLFKKSISVLCF